MAKAEHGNTVKIHYTGKLGDGEIFDSSVDKEPLEFTIGKGQVISGFEEGVIGMSVKESKVVNIPADKAYGPHRKEMIAVIDKTQFPPEIEAKMGSMLDVRQEDGSTVSVTITNVSDSDVTLDANHPLAGKDLTFDLQLVEIS